MEKIILSMRRANGNIEAWSHPYGNHPYEGPVSSRNEIFSLRQRRKVLLVWMERQIQLKPAIDVTFSGVTPQLSITTL